MPVALHRRPFSGRILIAILSQFIAVSVFAHARVVRSVPADRAVLTCAPVKIEFWFNELLDREFNRVEVYRAADAGTKERKIQDGKKPRVDSADKTHLIFDVEPLPAGKYFAEVQVLSRDGHISRSRISFSIGAD